MSNAELGHVGLTVIQTKKMSELMLIDRSLISVSLLVINPTDMRLKPAYGYFHEVCFFHEPLNATVLQPCGSIQDPSIRAGDPRRTNSWPLLTVLELLFAERNGELHMHQPQRQEGSE
jgi:hypothetical protein